MSKSAIETPEERVKTNAQRAGETMPYPESAIKTVEGFFPEKVLEETGMRQVIKDLDAAYGVEERTLVGGVMMTNAERQGSWKAWLAGGNNGRLRYMEHLAELKRETKDLDVTLVEEIESEERMLNP